MGPDSQQRRAALFERGGERIILVENASPANCFPDAKVQQRLET